MDSGAAGTGWSVLSWTQVIPGSDSITIATRTGETATPDGTWSAWSAELADEFGSDIASPAGRYLEYRTTLTRGTLGTQTPEFDDITLFYGVPTTQAINDIFILSSSDIWAVAGSGQILHYNGTSWLLNQDVGAENLYGIAMVSATDGWAVGASGKIYHYNGATWSEFTDTGTTSWNSIAMVSVTSGWIVGSGGAILSYNGTSWSSSTSPTASALNDIEIVAASDLWAVGDTGVIIRYNGTSWSLITTAGINLESVSKISASDVWASGASGNIWRWNGTSWSLFQDTGTQTWYAVDMPSSVDGWVVGNGGAIYHFNGASWVSATSPTGSQLNTVAMSSSLLGWAGGNTGTIIKFTRSALYQTSGTLTSSAFNMSDASPVQVIEWDETLPSCSPAHDQISGSYRSGRLGHARCMDIVVWRHGSGHLFHQSLWHAHQYRLERQPMGAISVILPVTERARQRCRKLESITNNFVELTNDGRQGFTLVELLLYVGLSSLLLLTMTLFSTLLESR